MFIDRIKERPPIKFMHFQQDRSQVFDREYCQRLEDDFYNNIDNAVAFNLNSIVGAYLSAKESKESGFSISRDVFAAIPPYPTTWTEHKHPTGGTVGCLLGTRSVPDMPIFVHKNALVATPAPTSSEHLGYISVETSAEPDDLVEISPSYSVTMTVVIELEKGVIATHYPGASYLVAKDGMPLTRLLSPVQEAHIKANSGAAEWTVLFPLGFISFYAFNLLACKNVQERLVPVSRGLQKARIRRNKPPMTEYRVLEIKTPIKQCVVTEQELKDAARERVETRFHAVRGHFANYSEDKPLFGKLSGRFWVPAHVRGSKDAGEIKKDYRITTPEATQ